MAPPSLCVFKKHLGDGSVLVGKAKVTVHWLACAVIYNIVRCGDRERQAGSVIVLSLVYSRFCHIAVLGLSPGALPSLPKGSPSSGATATSFPLGSCYLSQRFLQVFYQSFCLGFEHAEAHRLLGVHAEQQIGYSCDRHPALHAIHEN